MKRKTNGRNNSLALKLDMSKAYDRVEWGFLERVMIKMGFSEGWTRRVMSCITSVSFAFKINGCIHGEVIPTRGLRQGDPISPYLFLLCADVFSSLISKAVQRKELHGINICRGSPTLSHLFFADDSILFAKANVRECSTVANIISLYERASGQRVNFNKTEVSFSKGVPSNTRQDILALLRVNEVERHSKYLGMPTIIGRSKKMIFSCLKERIWKKIQGWKEKLLSRAGKEVLIKAVIQAIPSYMMSIFSIPDGIIDDIHSLLARFWWGSSTNARKTHWHNWTSLCRPKRNGGLGFRDLKCFNQALLAKQMWRLHNNSNPFLSAVLKARYYKHDEALEARRGFDPSFTWRSIWGAKSLLLEGLAWRVGNGGSVQVKSDKWVVIEGKVCQPILLNAHSDDFLVWHLIDHEARTWKVNDLRLIFDHNTVDNILSIPIAPEDREDMRYWRLTKDGMYTVKSGYWLSLGDDTNDNIGLWKKIWFSQWPPKLKHFVWRACKDSLPVNAVRHHRHMAESPLCSRCGDVDETVCHALVDCRKVRLMWQTHPLCTLINDAPRTSFAAALIWLFSHASTDEVCSFFSATWAAWYCRNKEIMANTTCDIIQTASSFSKLITDYQKYSQKLGISNPPRVLSYQKWEPPREGWVKINFDAHIGSALCRGLGVVVRDHNGKVLLTATRYMEANWNVLISEAAAAVYAIDIARRWGYDRVHLEGDSLGVITAITKQEHGNAHINLLTDYIIESSQYFDYFVCSFVRRHGNTVAHMVARWDTGIAPEKICMEPFPPSLLTLVDLDT